VYVDAEDVRGFLAAPGDADYLSYVGGENELVLENGEFADEVWLCLVPPDAE
jgi:hypothetical protein